MSASVGMKGYSKVDRKDGRATCESETHHSRLRIRDWLQTDLGSRLRALSLEPCQIARPVPGSIDCFQKRGPHRSTFGASHPKKNDANCKEGVPVFVSCQSG